MTGVQTCALPISHEEAGTVRFEVRDDGRGFDLPAPEDEPEAGHIGLVSMRERAEASGGRFGLESAPGEGTTVEFWMPEANGRPAPR